MNFSRGGGGWFLQEIPYNPTTTPSSQDFRCVWGGVGGHMTDKFFIKGLKNPYIITIIIILDYVQTCRNL